MDRQSEGAAARLTTQAQLERISEPWSITRTVAVGLTLLAALVLGNWVANGEFSYMILLTVWLITVLIVVFVRDHWWSPALVITAISFKTYALGFPLTGLEIGVVILAITFPVKMAMKTLRKAEPEYGPGIFYWLLVTYVCVHAVVIIFYNKIDGVPLKNIVKAYYSAITPLVFFGVLMRYCYTRTVKPAVYVIYFATAGAIFLAIVTTLLGLNIEPFSELQIDIDWLNVKGANGILRVATVYVFTGGIAFWPAVRSGLPRVLVGAITTMAAVGVLMSGGRLFVLSCIVASVYFAVIRGKLWLAIPTVVVTILVSGIMTLDPEVVYYFPESVQRGLAPLNFSEQKSEAQSTLEGSDQWHADLRNDSLTYWLADTNSIFLGHGFKSWDEGFSSDELVGAEDLERAKTLAIEMGLTENMFSAISNIFGAVGLVLYFGFLIQVAFRLWKGARLSPSGSAARALCEFSFVNLVTALGFCAFEGGTPGITLIYWMMGLLAARPYLAAAKSSKPVEVETEVPAFARPAFAAGKGALPRPGEFAGAGATGRRTWRGNDGPRNGAVSRARNG
jgi:hypothetical protein